MSHIARVLAKRSAQKLYNESIEVLPYSSFNIEKFGALSAAHHFSFGKYYDPKRVRHGLLRVFDDGLFQSTEGIPLHPHRNIDIISVVLHPNIHPLTKKSEGGAGIVHMDTGGGRDIIKPGNAQVMSIGHKGLSHTENITQEENGASGNAFQIWLSQTRKKNENTYSKVTMSDPQKSRNKFVVLASGFEKDLNLSDASVAKIQSDSRVLSAIGCRGDKLSYELGRNRMGYIVPASGEISVNGIKVEAHDAAKISNTEIIDIDILGDTNSEIILVDTPPHK